MNNSLALCSIRNFNFKYRASLFPFSLASVSLPSRVAFILIFTFVLH